MNSSEIFRCNQCSKAFDTRGRYNQHLKTHSKPFRCGECVKSFALRADLTRHVQARHRIGAAQHACVVTGCHFKASRKDNIRQHLRKSHPQVHIVPKEPKSGRRRARLHTTSSSIPLSVPSSTQSDVSLANTCTLMQAASAGNIGLVRVIIQLGIGVSIQADDGSTALHCAARANLIEMIHLLVGLGARSDVLNKKGRTPLHEAVSGRCTSAFNALVERTADITKHVLRETIETNQHELFQQAWEGCNKEMLGKVGRDLFNIVASSTQTASMATLLLLPEITPEWIFSTRMSTIRRIISKGQTVMLECLLKSKKLDPNINKPIFTWGSGSLIHFAAASGRAEVVGLLLKSKPINPNLVPSVGLSPVNTAALRGHFKTTEKLLEYPGIILDSRTGFSGKHTTNPLHLACRQGHVEIVRLMLKTFDERGLSVDDIGGSCPRRTPLQIAVFNGHTEVVKFLLLRQDIDVNRPFGSLEMSLCQVAVRRGHARTLGVLLGDHRTDRKIAKNSRDSLLFEAFREARWLLVEILLDYDEASPQITQRDLYTRTKVAGNHIDTLERLLVDTAFREYQTKNETENLWHRAARYNDLELAMLLLEHAQRNKEFNHPALDVNRRGQGIGDTPLHVAVNSAKVGIVELLLYHKDIDINITSKIWTHEPGQSAVQMAITQAKRRYNWRKEKHSYIVGLLLAHGARNVSHERGDDTNNLVLPPLLEHADDPKDIVLPPLPGHAKHQDYHSTEQTEDLRQKTHASWASVVGIQGNGVGSEETNREDEDVLGDMIPMDLGGSMEEDPDAMFEELMHFDDEEMSDYNSLEMLERETFHGSPREVTSFLEERNS